jgi:pyruvate,water dikinase
VKSFTKSALVLEWEGTAEGGASQAGGKGWALGRLARYGLPVPPGAVLSADAYHAFMASAGLADEAAALEAGDGEASASDATEHAATEARLTLLRERIGAAALPPALQAAIEELLSHAALADAPLAVRSSASAEDGAGASFAGMHQSFLNVPPTVEAVGDAVKACYASLWTPHALVYRQRLKPGSEVRMAVVVMRLVPAVAAGVAFTADPRSGRRDIVVVTANQGLGESVVGGQADPDEFHVQLHMDRPAQVLHRRLGRKERQTLLKPGGGTELAETEGASHAAITDIRARQVALLALRCQDAVGEDYAPQDVEWADDGDHLWVVQSRPITALPEPLPTPIQGQPVIWSTANFKEVVAPVPSPYSWSTIRVSINSMMESLVARTRYRVPIGPRFARLHQGHPFFNISLMQWMFYDCFGILPERFNQMLGGQQPTISIEDGTPYFGRRGLGRLKRLFGQAADSGRAFKEIPAAMAAWEAACRRQLATDVAGLSDAQLTDQLYETGALYLRYSPEFMRANSQAGSWIDMLTKNLEQLVPGRGGALATRLLAGTGGVASAEQGYRLAAIARHAAAEPQARAYFQDPHVDPLDWRSVLHGTQAGRALASFLEEFGHRGVDELEIAAPRWSEDPTYLIDTIRSYLDAHDEAPPEHTAAAIRQQAERDLKTALRFHPLRPIVFWMLDRARRSSALRENTKSILVLSMLPVRRIALEHGRRQVGKGILDAPEGVFWLTMWEHLSLLDGSWDGAGAQSLIQDRRARNAELLTRRVPDVMIGDAPTAPPLPLGVGRGEGPVGAAFTGIGVAAGTATGAARVIHHPREGASLQRGEVLVAPTTDPGWTPLFLRASALVMETGGYLSHGAIVAREYGIPAVANLPGILDQVRSGETLLVDGNAGRVSRTLAAP